MKINKKSLEILKPIPRDYTQVKVAVFDFDGTISTLRQGWEEVMEEFMVEMIFGKAPVKPSDLKKIQDYIDESTGIQTIFQMRWLVETVKFYGKNPKVLSEWEYKDAYNHRLLKRVKSRVENLETKKLNPQDFHIKGIVDFLEGLNERHIHMYAVSGTDHEDVVREAEALGVKPYFKKVVGAPHRKANCSKEAILKELIQEQGFHGSQILVIGDGKVEIGLGSSLGTLTLGVASDEVQREGINSIKRERLIKAGCHAIVGDYKDQASILKWLNMG